MRIIFLSLVTLFATHAAMADYNLAASGKSVECSADDSQFWNLNAKRTTLKYTVEGESIGAQKIIKKDTDGDTFVSYTTKEGTLTLSDQGDTYQFAEENMPGKINCQ